MQSDVQHDIMCEHIMLHSVDMFYCEVDSCDFKSTYARTLELHRKYCHAPEGEGEGAGKKAKSGGTPKKKNKNMDVSFEGRSEEKKVEKVEANLNLSVGGNKSGNNWGAPVVSTSKPPSTKVDSFNLSFSRGYDLTPVAVTKNKAGSGNLSGGTSGGVTPKIIHGGSGGTSEGVTPRGIQGGSGGHRAKDLAPNSGIFLCPICIDRPPFKYRKSYNNHMQQHSESGHDVAQSGIAVSQSGSAAFQPGYTVLQSGSAASHFDSGRSVSHFCPLCEEGFETSEDVQGHALFAHGTRIG